ncbi:MAG: hypothetical protein HQL01_12655 [Nitrospirae bacterium]|nr:hypothetical protein [Nitrospirota bacterium]
MKAGNGMIRKIEEALKEGHRRAAEQFTGQPDARWHNGVMARVRAINAVREDDIQRYIWPFAAATAACAVAVGLYAIFSGNGGGYYAFGVFIDDPSGISALQWFL